jgi:predicted RNA-binding Zn-ribbon protein involved in translation (DUF1610 family)
MKCPQCQNVLSGGNDGSLYWCTNCEISVPPKAPPPVPCPACGMDMAVRYVDGRLVSHHCYKCGGTYAATG